MTFKVTDLQLKVLRVLSKSDVFSGDLILSTKKVLEDLESVRLVTKIGQKWIITKEGSQLLAKIGTVLDV